MTIEAEKTNSRLTYPQSDQDATRQSSSSDDRWDQVDDFQWLRSEHSPNWALLEAKDTVVDDTWRQVVPGGPDWTLNDILRATKVPQ